MLPVHPDNAQEAEGLQGQGEEDHSPELAGQPLSGDCGAESGHQGLCQILPDSQL